MQLVPHVCRDIIQGIVSVPFVHQSVQYVRVQLIVQNAQMNTILRLIIVLTLVQIIRFLTGRFVMYVW